jgi:hypothetical protein
MSDTPLFISLIYCLDTEQGHLLSYNVCMGDACRLNGWEHTAAVRAAARVRELPNGWMRSLGVPSEPWGPRPVRMWRKFFSFIETTAAYLTRTLGSGERPVVLFLEWFDLVHIIAFLLALQRVPRQQLRHTAIWINFRFGFQRNFNLMAMKTILALIERRTPGRLVIFTENDLVAKSHAHTLGRTAYVLPMPQMVTPEEPWQLPEYAHSSDRTNRLVCFWPGQAAADKGLELVRSLTRSTSEDARRLVVVADESAGFQQTPNGCEVILLKKGLPRDLYIGWLRTMDLALVPYSPDTYANRTSGIFGDAIAVGVPPVVTDGTWMAHELRRFGLDALIIDWTAPDVAAALMRLAHDPEIKARMAPLVATYSDFHSRRGYARVINQIYSASASLPKQL